MPDKKNEADPEVVLRFWEEAGPEAWYKKDDAFDQAIRDQFGALWEDARGGGCDGWSTSARGALARIILLDQFPRNMFREDARAFATDDLGRQTARYAIDRSWDLQIEGSLRQFFYMPLMHSEKVADQDKCVRLIKERMSDGNNLLHARAHREIIRRFNRFPYRNAALGRTSTAAESDFMESGGYGAIVSALEAR
ncbi:MAG: DUF924 family protein [Roseicyclus sp.]|jgi:uncharacterized protein (DUF924 family)